MRTSSQAGNLLSYGEHDRVFWEAMCTRSTTGRDTVAELAEARRVTASVTDTHASSGERAVSAGS